MAVWPSGWTETGRGTGKRTVLTDMSTQPLALSLLPVVPTCFSVLLFPLPCRSKPWGQGASAGAHEPQQSWAAPSPAAPGRPARTSQTLEQAPQTTVREQLAGWRLGEALSRRVEGGARGGHQKEAGSVGREEVE